MNEINRAENLNITVYHSFLEEVKFYVSYHWKCGACTVVAQTIERAPPSCSLCFIRPIYFHITALLNGFVITGECEVCGSKTLNLVKEPETTIEYVSHFKTSM